MSLDVAYEYMMIVPSKFLRYSYELPFMTITMTRAYPSIIKR